VAMLVFLVFHFSTLISHQYCLECFLLKAAHNFQLQQHTENFYENREMLTC